MMVVGDGTSALFWADRWLDGRAISELAPNLVQLVPRRTQKNRTVREDLADRSWIRHIQGILDPIALWQYLRIWERLRMVKHSDAADTLCWRWTGDGQYSSKSCYRSLFHGGVLSDTWRLNWKSWAPPRVKFFIWLACQDRCWTAERRARHGLSHAPRCLLCNQSMETMNHLMVDYPSKLCRTTTFETVATKIIVLLIFAQNHRNSMKLLHIALILLFGTYKRVSDRPAHMSG